MSRETPEQESILNRAAVRWHSDDPIVCLQRALRECEQLDECARQRDAEQKPPMERVIEGLQNLSRIADTLERLAGLAPEPFPTGTPGELMGALVGAAMGRAIERNPVVELDDDDDDDEPTSDGGH